MKTKRKMLDEGLIVLKTYPGGEEDPNEATLRIISYESGVTLYDRDIDKLADFLKANYPA